MYKFYDDEYHVVLEVYTKIYDDIDKYLIGCSSYSKCLLSNKEEKDYLINIFKKHNEELSYDILSGDYIGIKVSQ